MKDIYTIWGYTRFYALKFGMELWYDLEDSALIKRANSWIQGNRIIEKFIGTTIGEDELLELKLIAAADTHPLEFMINNCLDKYILIKFLRGEHKLQNYYYQFLLVQLVLLLDMLANFSDVSKRSSSIIENFLRQSLNETILLILDLSEDLDHVLSEILREMMVINEDSTISLPEKMTALKSLSTKISSLLHPNNIKVFTEMERAIDLTSELDSIEPGRDSAKAYEIFCYKAMKQMLIPPFEQIQLQQANIDRSHIRDLVFTNNVSTGFWSFIRSEHGSKYIICELKNEKLSNSKSAVSQLNQYLTINKSFGNFAILIVRKAAPSLIKEIRRIHPSITILLFEDETLKGLILGYALLGNLDKLLQREKTQFELSF